MTRLSSYDSKPWHQQFWPWFIIVLPTTVVIAALITVYIAFKNADTVVIDQYYRDGFGIEQVLEDDINAQNYKLTSSLTWDEISGEILLTLKQEANSPNTLAFPSQLLLQLLHPLDQQKDHSIYLDNITEGYYRSDLEFLPAHRYYIRLSTVTSLPSSTASSNQSNLTWRLQGEFNFSQAKQVNLHYLER